MYGVTLFAVFQGKRFTRLNQFTISNHIHVFDQILSLLFVLYVSTTTHRIGKPNIVIQDYIIY